MTSNLRRPVLALCWIAIVGGALLFLAGVYTGYTEGVSADENQTVGHLMPAEVAAAVLGPILAVAGLFVVVAVSRSAKTPGEVR